ncbi:hypothetical protein BDV12DRAFT_180787, partial [Aspergillus spectabilis]
EPSYPEPDSSSSDSDHNSSSENEQPRLRKRRTYWIKTKDAYSWGSQIITNARTNPKA